MKSLVALFLLVLGAAPAVAGAAFDGRSTEQLCGLMKSRGFSGSPRWRDQGGGTWGCSTARKKLPQGEPAGASDLRYRVLGSEARPERLVLELRMRSYRGPQGVLARFYDYARALVEAALERPLPGGMRDAFLSAVDGEWIADGYRYRLEKHFSRGPSYDLWFIVELLPGEGISRSNAGDS